MRRSLHRAAGAASLSLYLVLAACGGSDSDPVPTPQAPAATPFTVPKPAGANFNVLPCLSQLVAPGKTVASLVVPDTVTIDLSAPSGFPNGRRLTDSVIDITLAALFLDLTKEPVTRLTSLPLGPQANDLPFRPNFPYLAAAQGNVPAGPVALAGFNFRTDPPTSYVRVDRMGMPAVATVVISPSSKIRYNDGDPVDDDQLDYYPDINATLKAYADALSDDFAAAGLK
ncbi:MAG: DUF4331 domain-containing protein, partial [Alphaproteobacteria bacterium]